MHDSTLVRSVAKHGILRVAVILILGRNAALRCLNFGWKFYDFAHSDIDVSNATLSSSHRRLVQR